ncbi:ubiquitin-conjugating enzyme e2 [Holotrichia oblita]|uniref:Ubiquitin-conjugating enzyme e2 n=1 Tax=Holotrichia oblita TaxID=644536 RepID=A0ACB9TQW1_HOLOL|nr:ubiquitin-conjugating enzyme e2 [Holotrichia oblita]
MTSNKIWSPDLTKCMICLYELQPVLYKHTSPNYHNKIQRLKALETIKEELEQQFKIKLTTEDINKKINNIRTQFLEVYRNTKKQLPSGSSCDDTKPSWWLYEDLLFLLPYCKKDKSNTNLSQLHTDKTGSQIINFEMNDNSTDEIFSDINIKEGEYTIESAKGMCTLQRDITSPVSIASISSTVSEKKHVQGTPTRKQYKRKSDSLTNIVAEAVQNIANEKSDLPAEIDSFCTYNGDLCISILHPPVDDPQSGELPCERWNPTQNVRTILLSVISLLNEPNTFSPANVDASVMYRRWRDSKGRDKEYENIIRKQAMAARAEAERDGIQVPLTLEDYCIKTQVKPNTSDSQVEMTDFYDDDYDEEYDDPSDGSDYEEDENDSGNGES